MIANQFTEALRTLAADGQELQLAEDGSAEIEIGGVTMTFVVPESAQDTVYCRACVGGTDGLDADALALALLGDNFMWQATEGATLSLNGGKAYLTDRRDDAYFAPPGTLAGYVARFASAVRLVREQMETFRPAAGEEAK